MPPTSYGHGRPPICRRWKPPLALGHWRPGGCQPPDRYGPSFIINPQRHLTFALFSFPHITSIGLLYSVPISLEPGGSNEIILPPKGVGQDGMESLRVALTWARLMEQGMVLLPPTTLS